jgi:hypothetical protein
MDDMRDWKKALTDYLVEKGHITKPKTRAAGLAGID